MKYFLSILIIGVSGFVGNLFARRYVERDCFYKEMKSMLVYFKSNISFLHQFPNFSSKRFITRFRMCESRKFTGTVSRVSSRNKKHRRKDESDGPVF